MRSINSLGDLVRQTAYDIHVYHGHGHLEMIYENALANRLRKQQLEIQQQAPITVYDQDGTVLRDYFADLLVERQLIVELKAVKQLINEHAAHLLGYLKSARVGHGLLINFGSFKFEVKKCALSQASPSL